MASEEIKPYSARFDKAMWDRMIAAKTSHAIDFMEIIRRGVERELDALEKPEAAPLKLKLTQAGALGEWNNSDKKTADTFEISPDMVREWNAVPTDRIYHVRNTDALGKNVPEDALLHMRPFGMRAPRAGQLCSILAVDASGKSQGAIGIWPWDGERSVTKADEGFAAFGAPKGTVELLAEAFWIKGNVIGLTVI